MRVIMTLIAIFCHDADWSRARIVLFFILFVNNRMNNGSLSGKKSATPKKVTPKKINFSKNYFLMTRLKKCHAQKSATPKTKSFFFKKLFLMTRLEKVPASS